MPNPEKLHPNTYPNAKSAFQDRKEEEAARQHDVENMVATLLTQLPDLIARFARIPDPRQTRKKKHQITLLLVYGTLLFLWP